MKHVVAVAIALGLVAIPVASQTQKPAALDTVIHAGRLIDGTSSTVREQVSVLIGAGRIVSVQAGFQTPAAAKVIDLRTATVMPGLIDAHTHITGEGTGNAIARAATETPLDDAVRSTVYARRTLEAGFTTIRNVEIGRASCRERVWIRV